VKGGATIGAGGGGLHPLPFFQIFVLLMFSWCLLNAMSPHLQIRGAFLGPASINIRIFQGGGVIVFLKTIFTGIISLITILGSGTHTILGL